MKTHFLSSYLYRKDSNGCFYGILREILPYPTNFIFRVFKMPKTGEIEVLNNFLNLEEAKTLFFKLCYSKRK